MTWQSRAATRKASAAQPGRRPLADPKLPTTSAPLLETERLRLRGHRLEDFEDLAAMWGSQDVNRYIGAGQTRQDAWERLLRYVGHWTLLGFGFWAVEEKASGRYLGDVGLADFKRAIDLPIEGQPECGWVLAPWCHGRGYATEAVREALAWADRNLPGRRAVCIIAPENEASLRVAEKCGFKEVATTTFKGSAAILFRR